MGDGKTKATDRNRPVAWARSYVYAPRKSSNHAISATSRDATRARRARRGAR